MIATFALALALATSTPPPCRIPGDALVILQNRVTEYTVAIFDLADGSQTCAIEIPASIPPSLAVARNGMIFVAIPPQQMTGFSSDTGRLDVFGPDGRLLHQIRGGAAGIQRAGLDGHGRLFVVGEGTFVNGESVFATPTLTMYDATSLTKLRIYPLDEHYRGSDLSKDGRYLAIASSVGPQGHVDLVDPVTGSTLRRIDVAARGVKFDGNTLLIQLDHGVDAVSPDDGQLRTTTRTDLAFPTRIIDGIEYRTQDHIFLEGGFIGETSTITRRRVADGTVLPPLAIHEAESWTFQISHPDVSLATARPDANVLAPTFPGVDDLRASLAPNVAGIEFDDTISGAHYAYLGDLARIDDPGDHLVTIIDCRRGVEIVADPVRRRYHTVSMDPLPEATPTPSPRLPVTLTVHATARAAWHSPLATMGYTTEYAVALPPAYGGSIVTATEREFAALPATYPSCADRTFGGEPAVVEPQRLFELGYPSTIGVADPPSTVHQVGSLPTMPQGALLVHLEYADGPAPVKLVVNIANVHGLGPASVSRFAVPAGYTEELPGY
jgi:hypothetical protein